MIIAASALSGCASGVMRPQLVAEPSAVDLRLADAADRATRAIETLASVEQVRTPGSGVAAIPNVPPELMKAMTFAWNGPAEPLVRDLAARSGYGFQVLGDRPGAPAVVSVQAQNTPIAEILRNIGLQLGTRADIKLDANRRMIELVYAPIAGQQRL